MQLLLCITCLALGALGAAIAVLAAAKKPRGETTLENALGGERPPERVLKQWENFLNYDGSERGQTSVED